MKPSIFNGKNLLMILTLHPDLQGKLQRKICDYTITSKHEDKVVLVLNPSIGFISHHYKTITLY